MRPRAKSTQLVRRSEPGSALIIVVLFVVVITIIALALISRNTDHMEAAGAKRSYDVAVSCADGARDLLMSQFRAFGTTPADIVIDATVDTKRYTTGHYDSFAVKTVTPTGGGQTRAVGVSDAANRTSSLRLGGALYRMTVVCTDTTNPSRQSEVEFLVRFGL